MWMLANMITLNKDKTEFIIFHKPGQSPIPIKVKLNGKKLHISTSIKYVGIYLDSTLSFTQHFKILNKKLNRANGMLSRARHYMQIFNLKVLYYAIFNCHLIYDCQVWGQTENQHTKKISLLQNKAVRIKNFTFDNTDQRYHRLNILKLLTIKVQNCIFVHRTLNKQTTICFHSYFNLLQRSQVINTRLCTLGCLQRSTFNTFTYGINSICNTCIITWNEMAIQLRINLRTLKDFQLKKQLTNNYIKIYTNND